MESKVTVSVEDCNIEITLACCSKIAKGLLWIGYESSKLGLYFLRAFTSLYHLLSQARFSCSSWWAFWGEIEKLLNQKWFCSRQNTTESSLQMKTRIKLYNNSDTSSLKNTTKWFLFCVCVENQAIWQTTRNYVWKKIIFVCTGMILVPSRDILLARFRLIR